MQDVGMSVYVVGAGASREVGFPIGDELGEQISEATRLVRIPGTSSFSPLDQNFHRLAHQAMGSDPAYRNDLSLTADKMRKLSNGVALAPSIDNYLALHYEDPALVRLGKIAIAYKIAEYERSCVLHHDLSDRDSAPKPLPIATWYGRFFKAITSQCAFRDLYNRLSDTLIICFNYDRNIQRFFSLAIQGLYDVPEAKANEALRGLHVWHPYGSLGPLPGLAKDDGRPYGQEITTSSLLGMADGLRTFTEGAFSTYDSSESLARARLRMSSRFVFLGFGFLPANMRLLEDLLRDSLRTPGGRTVFGTCLNASDFDRDQYTEALAELFMTPRSSVHLSSKSKCADLFHEFSVGLRFP